MQAHKETNNNNDVRDARRVTWVGFWINAILGAIKIIGGIFGRSSALVADGIHSLSDFFSDIIVIIMVGTARKSPDRGHEFGHGRYESLATLILALMLAIVAVGLFYEGVTRTINVWHGEKIPAPLPITLAIIVASIISKEWLFHYTKKIGKRIHSEAVIANAWHHRSDAFSSLATLAGVAGAMFFGENWRILDPIAAIVVSIFIIIVSIDMAKPALAELLGASLSDKDQRAISSAIDNTPGIIFWHNLRTFKSGKDAYIEVHIKVDPQITVSEAHDIATAAEHNIAAALTDYDVVVTTHIEPASPVTID